MANKRKKHSIYHWLIPLTLLVVMVGYGYIAYAPVSGITSQTTFVYAQPTLPVSLNWPTAGEAAVGVAGYGILAEHGGNTPVPTASAIKILTALAVLKQRPLDPGQQGPLITISQTDVDSYVAYTAEDGSVVRVSLGEQISEYQALEALLLPSADNMADTLARWAFGSVAAYNVYANTLASQLGMQHTTVTDPSGLLPTTLSTPYDLALLGEAALANPVVAQIVDESSATIPTQGTIYNVDTVLGVAGIRGIKTGNNDQDKGCFMFAADQTINGKTVTIFGAVMDQPSLGTALWATPSLIQSVTHNFSMHTINVGEQVATYSVPWQGTVQAVTAIAAPIVTWNDKPVTISVTMHSLHAPIEAGNTVGMLTVRNTGNGVVQRIPIRLTQTIKKPSFFWRLMHIFRAQ